MLKKSVLATGFYLPSQDYTCLFQAQLAIHVDFSTVSEVLCGSITLIYVLISQKKMQSNILA